jgi:hypothetical protein
MDVHGAQGGLSMRKFILRTTILQDIKAIKARAKMQGLFPDQDDNEP